MRSLYLTRAPTSSSKPILTASALMDNWLLVSCRGDYFLTTSISWCCTYTNPGQWTSRGCKQQEHTAVYLSCLLEGGACVMTEVGEGRVGWSASLLKCRGREPGRTMVGVGAELTTGFVGSSCWRSKQYNLFPIFKHVFSAWTGDQLLTGVSNQLADHTKAQFGANVLYLASHPWISAIIWHAGRGIWTSRRGRIDL